RSVEAIDVSSQSAGAGGVVRAVEDDVGIGAHVLQAARPARLGDAALDGGARHAELHQRGRGGRRVLHLMFAGEWTVDVQIAETEAARAGVDFDIGWSHCRYDRYTEFGGMCLDHRSRFFALRRDYHRHSALEDARLLPGDRFQAAAEVLLVIVVDWRDHAQFGCD